MNKQLNEFQLKNTTVLQFDSIRWITALFVIITHHDFKIINVPYSFAYASLHSFFIMSAFLISRGLILSKPKYNSFKNYYKDFYYKRILRIFPVYFLYLFTFTFIGFILFIFLKKDVLKLISEYKNFGWMLFGFTYNCREFYCYIKHMYVDTHPLFNHLWSLSLEEQFYIFIPFVIFFINRKKLVYVSFFIIILMPILRIWFSIFELHPESDVKIFSLKLMTFVRSPFFQLDCFFYGVLLAVYPFKPYVKFYRFLFYIFLVAFVLILCVYGIMMNKTENIPFHEALYSYQFMYYNYFEIFYDTFLNVFLCILFINSFYSEKFLSFMNNKYIIYIGNKLSYSTYVYQYILIIPTVVIVYPLLKKHTILPEVVIQLFCICFSVAFIYLLSYISYEKMEKKFLAMKPKIK